jgi:hypothetical protein
VLDHALAALARPQMRRQREPLRLIQPPVTVPSNQRSMVAARRRQRWINHSPRPIEVDPNVINPACQHVADPQRVQLEPDVQRQRQRGFRAHTTPRRQRAVLGRRLAAPNPCKQQLDAKARSRPTDDAPQRVVIQPLRRRLNQRVTRPRIEDQPQRRPHPRTRLRGIDVQSPRIRWWNAVVVS